MLRTLVLCATCLGLVACGDDGAPPATDAGPPPLDGGGVDAGGGTDAGHLPDGCAPVTSCSLGCALATGADGCPLCDCERPSPECAVDDDCTLATHHGVCCPACADAYPRSTVEAEPCLRGNLRPAVDQSCTPDGCGAPCPDVLCAAVVAARCDAGRCVPIDACPEGQVGQLGACVPACEADADCVLVTEQTGCCDRCPVSVHVDLAASEPCLSEGGPRDPACGELPSQCAEIDCVPIGCDEQEPFCQTDGTCGARTPP